MSKISESWYKIKRPLFNSGLESDEFNLYGRDGFYEVLESFIGYDVLIYDKRPDVEPYRVRAIIQSVTGDTQSNSTKRQILAPIGTLHTGQYVVYDDTWWIVCSYVDNNRIYEKAVLWKCLSTIHFKSPETGEQVNYPVYVENAMSYSVGTSSKEYMTLSTDSRLVYIPYNTETILIPIDFRMIIDKNQAAPDVFKIVRVDPVSFSSGDELFDDGLIQWQVQRTQFNEAVDSELLMTADSGVLHEGNSDSDLVTDADGDWKLAVGESKTLTISADEYTLEYDAPDGTTVEDDGGGTITLSAGTDRNLIGQYITLSFTVPSEGESASQDESSADEDNSAETESTVATVEIQIVGW